MLDRMGIYRMTMYSGFKADGADDMVVMCSKGLLGLAMMMGKQKKYSANYLHSIFESLWSGEKGGHGERGGGFAEWPWQGGGGQGGGGGEAEDQGSHLLLSFLTILKPISKVELKDPCPFLPSLSNSIDIEWTEARGRFAVANRPIAAGGGVLLGLAEKKMAF